MNNAPIQTANEGAGDTANFTTGKFAGTDNPRHLRAIHALLTRPQRRKHLDDIAGCSNTPELIAELRRRGLAVAIALPIDHDIVHCLRRRQLACDQDQEQWEHDAVAHNFLDDGKVETSPPTSIVATTAGPQRERCADTIEQIRSKWTH